MRFHYHITSLISASFAIITSVIGLSTFYIYNFKKLLDITIDRYKKK